MFIDASIRNRWNLPANKSGSTEREELNEEPIVGSSLKAGIEISSRFRASAQEWLSTWRIVE
tara:strand:- start:559 stop:744 length:186 start_codon:yes stop_codon:yes gene_type:complete